jgi:hypothetical protein
MGHVGTGAPTLAGSTLPWVGQWYSIFMFHRSTRSTASYTARVGGPIASTS